MTDYKKQIALSADASGVEAGVGKAKRSLADLGVAAVTEGKKAADGISSIGKGSDTSAAKLDASTKNMIGSIQRTTAALEAGGRSGSKYFETLAAQRGIDPNALKPYLAQLDAVNAKQAAAKVALDATAPSLGKVGISAAQTAAALRGVPAQFTDIVTSLQGGQAPLTVFLQQGGQLKDMFGGLGPAARALGGYIASLVTPLTLAAAGVGVLAYAYYQASQRNLEFNKALITTGNYAGTTASQLDALSKKIAGTIGTQGQAADALTALAATGRIAGESLEQVATAIVAQNKGAGTAIKELVAEYVKLAEEPTKASAKLNESLNYLNLATYERIRALEDQGRQEEAAALAQSTYATAAINRFKQVQEQAGLLSRALSGLKGVATGMWEAVAGGLASIGAQQTAAERLIEAQRKLNYLKQNGGTSEALANAQNDVSSLSRQAIRDQDNAAAEADRARTEQAKIAASTRLADQKKATRDRAAQRKDEIDQLKRDAELVGLSKDEYDKRAAAINEKYKDPKGAKPKAVQDDAATKFIESLRQTEASLAAQLAGEEKLTGEQREQVKFQQLIADLKDKKILTAEQKSLLANRDSISAQLEKNVGLSNQIKFEEKIADIVKKSAADAAEFARQVEAANISMQASQEGRDEQSSRSLNAFGLGDRARQEVEAQRSIRNEFQRYLTQITKQAADKNQLGSDAYKEEVERIKAALNDALASQAKYFSDLKAKQADWKNGATTALSNYADSVNNIAAQTDQALSNGFNGAEDALTRFVTTGQGSFKSLADSIIADLARIAIRQSITGPLAKGLLGALGGGGGFAAAFSQTSLGASGGGTGLAYGNQDFGGFFADGGSPPMGKVSVVGEKGPELFVPSVPGTIIPNAAMGGQSIVVNQNFTVGDVPTMSMVREAVAGSERRITSGFRRSRAYGGEAA